MNERIKELIKTKSAILFPGTDTVDCQITDIEKFAELIIRDCLDQLSSVHQVSPYDSDINDFELGFEKGVTKCQHRINSHFGVK